jgi:excisionase family DNA binding protein
MGAQASQAGILTVPEVAQELRCSKAHVHNLIHGKVPGVRPLPSLWLGRRRLVLRASFNEWIASMETRYEDTSKKQTKAERTT